MDAGCPVLTYKCLRSAPASKRGKRVRSRTAIRLEAESWQIAGLRNTALEAMVLSPEIAVLISPVEAKPEA
jgi:hypothetical protein